MVVNNSTIGEIFKETQATSDEYQKSIKDTIEKLKKDPSNSADLAEFQAAMAAHSVLLNFMSTTIKAHKENAQTILGNMR
ncbi:MAG: EscF/YscF/HrpA family type III secretion system needle major subunit [Candidatus Arsenophonus phytopathogenicus]